jgi:signal transduction histidine kinase
MTKNQEELIRYLGNVSSKISSIDNINSLVNEISKIIEELIRVEVTAIYFWSPKSQRLVLHKAKGLTAEDIKISEESAMDRHPGWVFRNKKIFHVPDTDKDDGKISKTVKRSFKVRSRLYIPVINMEKCLGTLGFASAEPNAFTTAHITVLSFVANISGAVYSNIILLDLEKEHQKKIEIALKEANIAKSNQQSFFAKMNHELRTPMNAIIGMSHLLAKTSLNPEQRKYLRAVSTSSKSLLNIINDILDLSKLQSDQFSLESINFSIKDIVLEVYNILKYQAKEKNTLLQYHVSDDITLVLGDPVRISQVLINLVNNAIKFTNNGSVHINVNLLSENREYQEILFVVLDTGKGISQNKLDTIFKSFKQEDDSITRSYGGTGLGLTIAEEIVGQYGAKINVKSLEKVGSEFSFNIKLNKSKEFQSAEVNPYLDLNYDLKGIHILLVEDNEINQLYAETILQQEGANVTVVNNGKEATIIVQSQRFDIILMDIQMPVMNGFDATVVIRKDLSLSMPIIGLSANTTDSDVDNCLAVGMNGYVAKPFVPKVLYQKIGEYLMLSQKKVKPQTLKK